MKNFVIQFGKNQYIVKKNNSLFLPLNIKNNTQRYIVFNNVLAANLPQSSILGKPIVKNARIFGMIISTIKNKKINITKSKIKKGYKKSLGYRHIVYKVNII
jgi:large subunit ribosomal protein L21